MIRAINNRFTLVHCNGHYYVYTATVVGSDIYVNFDRVGERGGKMTIEQAKSELMQMYGVLVPNKQIAIDTLIKASVKSQESQIRPKGHWKEVDTNMYACSKCSHVLAIDPLINSITEMNTCPFCGAKMESEDKKWI